MSYFEWTPRLSVGIPEFDDEHVVLIALMSQLYEAMQAGHGKDEVGRVLAGLVQYTKTHFANEEREMRAHGYPDYLRHKAEHDALTARVCDVQARYRSGKAGMLSLELMTFLKEWLVSHILGSDKKYVPYLSVDAARP